MERVKQVAQSWPDSGVDDSANCMSSRKRLLFIRNLFCTISSKAAMRLPSKNILERMNHQGCRYRPHRADRY